MPKSTQRALSGALRARCPKALKSTPRGTFRPGPLGTPVNGGRDHNAFSLLLTIPTLVSSSGTPTTCANLTSTSRGHLRSSLFLFDSSALMTLLMLRSHCLSQGNDSWCSSWSGKISPRFSARSFVAPPWGHGRPHVRVMDVRTQMLGFPKFRGPARSFHPGRPHE